jgi:hypothetical protein
MGNPKISFGIFLLLSTKSQNSKWIFEFKALATDMAFASTPYIKAGIDLFSFTNKECLNAILIMIRYYQVTKVNKTLTNNRVFKNSFCP